LPEHTRPIPEKEGYSMSASIRIEPVTDRNGIVEYVKFPFRLYRGDPNWVPPLIEERRDFFDTKKNPFYEHARFQLFLARREGELVGTIGAVVNDNHNTFHDEKSGAFGFFEAIRRSVLRRRCSRRRKTGCAGGDERDSRAAQLLDQRRGRDVDRGLRRAAHGDDDL
jgi:hypothetical protein